MHKGVEIQSGMYIGFGDTVQYIFSTGRKTIGNRI